MKKIVGLFTALSIAVSSLTLLTVHADEEIDAIACTQSASYITGGSIVLNTKDSETVSNVSWLNKSGQYKGVAVLEFELPAIDAEQIKSVSLNITVSNPSTNRKGDRTYDMYASDIAIGNETTIADLNTISFSSSLYSGAAVPYGKSRTDSISTNTVVDYIKSRTNATNTSKVQFAFSNSAQTLNIDPKTATINITTYGGGIALEKNKLTMTTADRFIELGARIFVEGVQESELVWESSNTAIASVSDGVITPHKAGTVTITVKTANGEYADSCEVSVLQSAESISVDKTSMTLVLGGKNGELTARVSPENSVSKVTWKSNNASVATVSANGIVIPKSKGSTIITAQTDGELTAKCAVTVIAAAEAEEISLDKDRVSLVKLGSTAVLNATVKPDNTDGIITWISSDETVAKVVDGAVISQNPGTATITAITSNGLRAECVVTVSDDRQLITNDRFYEDTDGNNLYSQGGGIFKFGDTYYWYGVRYVESATYAENPRPVSVEHPAFEAFTCYTSKDLVNWDYRGDVATLETLGESWCGWAGRMGVVYHERTGKYILCSQFNGTIIASAYSPLGPFKKENGYFWFGDQTSIPGVETGQTGDQTMFQDDDGKAYMICSSSNGRGHLYIVPMDDAKGYCDFDTENIIEINGSTSKYFDEDGTIKTKDKGGIEGDCMFKYNGKYYFTGSDLYGWHGSRVYVFQADSIDGDYNIKPNYNISDRDKSNRFPYIMKNAKNSYAHNSQTGFYYTLHGSKKETVIYCGDRWCDFGGHGIGYNEWVPLSFEGENDTPVFNDLSQWRLDEETGEWSVGEGNNYIANNEFDADRILVQNLTGWECRSTTGTACGNVKTHRYYGTYAAKHDGAEDYKAVTNQNVKDLPDGIYTLRASVMSSGGQNECVLYINNGEMEYSESLKASTNGWKDVVIKNIEVKNGECEIGVRSDANAGNYVYFDDMYLTKNSDTSTKDMLRVVDADGNTVKSLEPGVAVHAVFNGEYTDTATLYMAVYNEDFVLTDIRKADSNGGKSIETNSVVLGDNADKIQIKLFVWDSEQKPIAMYNGIY
ncbi:MAG: Ig-like domain-containing protein [Clostridia bacterium]|nr:Ig-like domain-containing protein [Clostridia bacterium]